LAKLRVGIIGCGGIARSKHLPAWASLPDVEIAAICDIDEGCISSVSEQYGVKKSFKDYNEMLEHDGLDAVDVCTPNMEHMPAVVAALEKGKHVLVEKPIARNAKEAAQMVEAARRNGAKLMVAQVYRFRSDSVLLKRYIDAGELGEIYYARVHALRRRGVPSWGVFTDKEKQGGGPLIDIGVHPLDLTLWLMGHPKPVAASGVIYTKFGNREGTFGIWGPWDYKNYSVEDFAAGIVRFENGAALTVEASFAANIEKDVMTTSLLGTDGGADLSPLKIYREEYGSLVDLTPVSLPQVDAFHAEIKAFVECIRNDTEPPVTGEQGLDLMKIIDAIYKSAETGREVAIE